MNRVAWVLCVMLAWLPQQHPQPAQPPPQPCAAFAFVPLTGQARSALRAGRNTIVVHTHQTRGGQFIDVGIVDVIE